MPVFPKPKFQYDYKPADEIKRLQQHRLARQVPGKADGRLLLATWNIANLGAQERRDQDHHLIAEILSWFDIVAVQECRENFGPLMDIIHHMGDQYRCLMSDAAGNNERMAFVYNSEKVMLLEEIGEISFPVSQLKRVKLPGVSQKFQGFDRTPYLATFQCGNFTCLLINVHLYYGTATGTKELQRRSLEAFAVALWAADREKSGTGFTRDVIALGDFNLPKADAADPIFKAITKKGLQVPEHTSQVGSNLEGDKEYDQIAFFPGETQQEFTGKHGVFDFDMVVFPSLWDNGKGETRFKQYLRYYLSDHRPMWMEFRAS